MYPPDLDCLRNCGRAGWWLAMCRVKAREHVAGAVVQLLVAGWWCLLMRWWREDSSERGGDARALESAVLEVVQRLINFYVEVVIQCRHQETSPVEYWV